MSGLIIVFLLFSLKASHVVIGTTKPHCSNVSISENDILTFFLTNISSHESARPVWDHKTPVNVNISFHLRNLVRVVCCFLGSLISYQPKVFADQIEIEEEVSIRGYIEFTWIDQIHRWDHIWPLNCIDYIIIPHGYTTGIWIPFIAFSSA